jgi:magnesium chelatase family protein
MDRFDLQLSMTRLRAGDLIRGAEGESSASVRARVQIARTLQQARFDSWTATNAAVSKKALLASGQFRDEAYEYLRSVLDKHRLTGRGMDRVLRVARTIADLRQSEDVTRDDVANALGFRCTTERREVAA